MNKNKRAVIHFIKQHRGIRVFNRHWPDGQFIIPDGKYENVAGGYEITGKDHNKEEVKTIIYTQDLFLWEIFYD